MSTLSIAAVPPSLLVAVDTVARETFGSADLQGAPLAAAVARVSGAYRRANAKPSDLRGERSSLCARLRFFLPRDFPKVTAPLRELAARDALPKRELLRVLDAGAGLGTTGLAAGAFLLDAGCAKRVRMDAIDEDAEALAIAARLAEHWTHHTGHDLQLRTRVAPITSDIGRRLEPPYDLILLGFVLNELTEDDLEPVQRSLGLLKDLSSLLAADGALVVLEPALRQHSRVLQAARTELVKHSGPPFVFAPCLHRAECPLLARERDWCHERIPLALPEVVAKIARAARLREQGLSFSYLSLHAAERTLAELGGGTRLLRVVGSPLASKGKLELAVCGADTVQKLRRLDRHAGPGNQALNAIGRGAVLGIDGIPRGNVLRIGPDTVIGVLQIIAPR